MREDPISEAERILHGKPASTPIAITPARLIRGLFSFVGLIVVLAFVWAALVALGVRLAQWAGWL